jgi:hypothetical protein
LAFPSLIKEVKIKPDFKTTAFLVSLMMAFPFINMVILYFYLEDRYSNYNENKEKQQHKQKYPGLVSINILKDIRNKYSDIIANTEDIELKKQLIPIENDLVSLIESLEANYQKPEFARIFSLYEITFVLLKSTIEESEQISDELTNEILLVSKNSIEQVLLEVEQVSNNKVMFEKETMEAIKKTFVDRIKEDQEYHSKRTGNSL